MFICKAVEQNQPCSKTPLCGSIRSMGFLSQVEDTGDDVAYVSHAT